MPVFSTVKPSWHLHSLENILKGVKYNVLYMVPHHWHLILFQSIYSEMFFCKTIGRTSPFPRERLDSALLEQGVDPASVAEGPFIQLDAAGIQEVVDGVVDGALLMAPISSMAREAGLVSPYDLNLSGDSVAYGIMTTDWMLAENRDEVKRFLRALLRSTADLKQNRELARSLVEQQFVPDRYIDQALDATLPYLNESGELAIESQQRWIDISRRLLGLETPVALDQVFDFSILQELAAEAAD